MKLVLVDACGANIRSVLGALDRAGCDVTVSADAEVVKTADKVILPGVGTAGDAMQRLKQHKLDVLIPLLEQPVLGICIGMQVLFAGSEEDNVDCLGVFPERLRRFPVDKTRPVPHMGWNTVSPVGITAESVGSTESEHPLLAGINEVDHCYFVHSYAAPVFESTIAVTDYGRPFTAAVASGNFMGVQFHPERSGEIGQRLLNNFLNEKVC